MKPALSLISFGAPPAAIGAELSRVAEKRTCRAVEWIAQTGGGAPGALRNAAVERATGGYFFFVDEREGFETTFIEQACRVLDGAPGLAFVTGWLDGLPERADEPPRPVDAAMLLARPWFVHVPTLYRKSTWREAGGFDEKLTGAEEVDFCLRLLARGGGAGVEEPLWRRRAWGTSSGPDEAVSRRLFERHRALFDAHFEPALLGKERIFRQLVAQGELFDEKRRKLERENDELNHEAALLQALLARHGGK